MIGDTTWRLTLAGYERNLATRNPLQKAMHCNGLSPGSGHTHRSEVGKFFVKEVDAQLEFVLSESGVATSLMLYQGGQDLPGKKIK